MSAIVVNLPLRFENAQPEQACRACIHSRDRLHNVSLDRLLELRSEGADLDDFFCQPTEPSVYRRMVGTNIVDSSSKVEGQTTARITSCGQTLQKKCISCKRLERVTVSVPYTLYEGGPTRYREVLVGGHCTIPSRQMMDQLDDQFNLFAALAQENPDDMQIGNLLFSVSEEIKTQQKRIPRNPDGDRVFCDFVPKQLNIDPSCLNCKFRMTTSTNMQLDEFLMIVAKTDLTPYEMEQARIYANDNGIDIGRAINEARSRLLSNTQGIYRWFTGLIIDRRYIDAPVRDTNGNITTQQLIDAYLVRFAGSGDEAWISIDEEHIRVYELANNRITLCITSPHHTEFGFGDDVRRRRKIIPSTPKSTVINSLEFFPELAQATCPRCTTRRACYYHAKGPVYNIMLDEVVFESPENVFCKYEDDALHTLRVIISDDNRAVVVDGDNNEPHPAVFNVRVRSLMDRTRNEQHKMDIFRQYLKCMSTLQAGPLRQLDLGYGVTTNDEPFKSYCSHPHGLNFRDIMGDRFGIRENNSWAEKMDRDEYLRAQVMERQFSPAQVHLEILANEMMLTDWRQTNHIVPIEEPAEYKVTRLNMFGDEVDPTRYDMSTDRNAYLGHQRETIEIKRGEEIIRVSRMMAEHGVDLAMGRRGQAEPGYAFDVTQLSVSEGPEELTAFYICVHNPDHRFEAGDPSIDHGEFDCPTCSSPLVWHEAGHEDLPARVPVASRTRSGIGYGIASDSSGYQEQTRLLQLNCDEWELKGSSFRRPFNMDSLRKK